jgi:predicted metal-dependent hydrolase
LKERRSGVESGEEFQQGVDQFNAEKFFDAHETWEAIWLKAMEPDKTFLQGITQVTAAFHHHAQGNREGAESLLQKGLRKLEQFPADYRRMSLEKLREELRKWAKALEEEKYRSTMKKPRIGWVRKEKG